VEKKMSGKGFTVSQQKKKKVEGNKPQALGLKKHLLPGIIPGDNAQ